MPARFDRVAAVFAGSVRRTFGERLRLRPQRRAGGMGGAGGDDAARPALDFVAAFSRAPAPIHRQGEGSDGATNVTLAAGKWVLWLDAPAVASLGARAGDLVERLDAPLGEPVRFRLSEPLPNDGGMIHPAEPV